jgi:hypothetical protein
MTHYHANEFLGQHTRMVHPEQSRQFDKPCRGIDTIRRTRAQL